MKKIILDGNNFSDKEGFYNEIDKILTKNIKFKTGHNLDALNDLLKGGFGVHKYGDDITFEWVNYDKSKKDLGSDFVLKIFEIIIDLNNNGHIVNLVLY